MRVVMLEAGCDANVMYILDRIPSSNPAFLIGHGNPVIKSQSVILYPSRIYDTTRFSTTHASHLIESPTRPDPSMNQQPHQGPHQGTFTCWCFFRVRYFIPCCLHRSYAYIVSLRKARIRTRSGLSDQDTQRIF